MEWLGDESEMFSELAWKERHNIFLFRHENLVFFNPPN